MLITPMSNEGLSCMGHYSPAQVLESLQTGYPDNIAFFLEFYEPEQAKKLWLESKVCQKYGSGAVASTEPCVINSNRVNTVSVSVPLLVAQTLKWLSTAVTCVCKRLNVDIKQ